MRGCSSCPLGTAAEYLNQQRPRAPENVPMIGQRGPPSPGPIVPTSTIACQRGKRANELAREAEERRPTGAGEAYALAIAAHHDEDGAGNVVFGVVETAAVSVLADAVYGRRLRRLARRGSARGVHRVAVLRPARVMRAASGTLSRPRRRKGNLPAPAPSTFKTHFGLGLLDRLRLALVGVRLADAGIGQTK